MNKIKLLVLLIIIFLCACTFIDKYPEESLPNQDLLFERFNEAVNKAEAYTNLNGTTKVKSVFQHETHQKWKIEFTNGLIVFYDEQTGDVSETE